MIASIDMFETAYALAVRKHYSQMYGNKPYIYHILKVISGCETVEQKILAALHDILEDTDCTVDDLVAIFPSAIVDAVVAITKLENEDYKTYLWRVRQNELATYVKIKDVISNLSHLSELETTDSAKALRLIKKYEMALRTLLS